MRSGMLLVLTAMAAAPMRLSAQLSCSDSDGCQKAADLFQYMAPQLGAVIAGGNAALGQGGTLGGFATFPFPHPKFSIGLRVNALRGSLPDLKSPTSSPVAGSAQRSTIPVEDKVIPAPAADVAIGLFKGLSLGLTNIFGVDLLLSAVYIPGFDQSNVSLELPDGGLKIGYGARVGLLQESLVLPGVSVTWLKRDLPKANISGTTPGAVVEPNLTVKNLDVNTTSWRIVASKSLVVVGLAVGAGGDRYDSSADVWGTAGGLVSLAPRRVEQTLNRTSYFADLSMNLMALKIIGEVGMVQGGTVDTFNQWDGKQPDDRRIYGSVGTRFSF